MRTGKTFWRRNIRAAAFGLLLGCALCWRAGTAEAKLMNLSHFTLGNGLEVAVVENHKAPIVLQMLYYKTGSVNDPKGKGGIAHLLEHMMFRGTKRLPDQAFNRLTEEHGAVSNAYTTYNETGYYEFSDIAKLELMMAMEAERMSGLEMDEAAFAKERDVVLQERRQRFETNPVPLFYETLNKILWQGHPLANPVSGSPEEIKALSVADARDFYRRYYRPDNALLVLAGDIGAREARDLAQKYYGGIARPEGSVPQSEFEKGRAAEAETAMKLAGVEQPRYADYIRLDAGEFSKTDILSLQLLAEYLAGDDTAPLYDCLVYRGKTLLGIDADVSYDDKLGGTFAFYATPAPEWLERAVLDGSGALRAVKEEIGRATEKALAGLTEEKLDKIKNRTLADTVYLQENPQTAAAFAGGMLTAGYSPDEIMNFDAAVQAATVSDIRAAWAKVQASRARATGWLEGKNAGKDTGFSGADAEAAERENAGKRGSL